MSFRYLIFAALGASVALPTMAAAQNPNAIQSECSSQAQQSWPDDHNYNSYGRARQQVYINCMTEHGLRP